MPRPKLIQFWDASPPPEVSQLLDGWWALNGEFEYRWYDERQAADFITADFGDKHRRIFKACALPAMKADFSRYCALYVLGGVYVDAGIECLRPIYSLTEAQSRGLLLSWGNRIRNGFMYFRDRRDPLMDHAHHEAMQNIADKRSNNVWDVTRPGILTRPYHEESPRREAAFLGVSIVRTRDLLRFFRRRDLLYRKNGNHWSTQQNHVSIFLDVDRADPAV